MKYIEFTYVDSVTGISCHVEPVMTNGPKFPEIPGLDFVFAKESEYPTDKPRFFGKCPDSSNIDVVGVIKEMSAEDFQIYWNDELNARNWIPKVISMRQARLALLQAGLLDDVEAAIAAIPDAMAKRAAEIEWEFANEVSRNSAFMVQMAQTLGLTNTEVDDLFKAAVIL